MKIQNPILRGFHPDPSIVRVGDDYFIATSTFEWWPGVQISHSKDLANWETYCYALTDPKSLDLKGVGASQGIWAPCLTYDNGVYYLVYTVVNSFYCNMYDTKNYLVTATNIQGPWSAPVPLNHFGFDPSLFHDDDGRKYMVCMVTDHRVPKKYAGRLVLQEYSAVEQKMIGPVKEIYTGTDIFLEGPHIFKRNGWYYLFSADTGTGEGHGQTIQRSRSVWGPYEMYQNNRMERTSDAEAYSILTSRHHEDYLLQKSGHADLVETQNGEWYAVHLCGRALENRNEPDRKRFPNCRRYTLGRETAIQKMKWTDDDWLILDNGTTLPDIEVTVPDLPALKLTDMETTKTKSEKSHVPSLKATDLDFAVSSLPVNSSREHFDTSSLSLEWQSLRIPMTEEYMSFTAQPGWLRLYGKEGLASKFRQTLIARRWTEFRFTAATCMNFQPEVFKQMAGLICMYDTDNYLYLHVSYDEDLGKVISILRAENKSYSYPVEYLAIPEHTLLYLKVEVDHDKLQFYYSCEDEHSYQKIGTAFDCSFLSDEACDEGWFTGSMVGICCQDLTGFSKYADFNWFEYNVF